MHMNIEELSFNIETECKTNVDKALRYSFIINHLIELKNNLRFDPHPNIDIVNVNDDVLKATHSYINNLIEMYKFKFDKYIKNNE